MNKLKIKLKKQKRKILLILLALLIVAIGLSVYLYNNNKAYNSYLEVLSSYGYIKEDVFWQDNTFVKNSTLEYMQYELDKVVDETNQKVSSLDSIISFEAIKEDEQEYSTPYEEMIYKDDLVRNYIDNITIEYDISTYLKNNNLSSENTVDYYNNAIDFLDKKVNDNLNNIKFEATDLTADEKKDKTELKTELENIQNLDLSELSLRELSETLEAAKSVKKDINSFEDDVKDRQKQEEAEENAVTSNATNQLNTWSNLGTNNIYSSSNESQNTTSVADSSSSGGSSTSSNSANSSSTTSYMCAYTSESSAIAAGEASGTSWDVTNCGDGSFQLSLGGGDNTGGNGDLPDFRD